MIFSQDEALSPFRPLRPKFQRRKGVSDLPNVPVPEDHSTANICSTLMVFPKMISKGKFSFCFPLNAVDSHWKFGHDQVGCFSIVDMT